MFFLESRAATNPCVRIEPTSESMHLILHGMWWLPFFDLLRRGVVEQVNGRSEVDQLQKEKISGGYRAKILIRKLMDILTYGWRCDGKLSRSRLLGLCPPLD